MTEDSFVGTWRLTSFETRTADGQVQYLFGEDAVGYLMYHADGYMSVAFMTADRAPLSGDDPGGGSLEEKAAALDTFFSYCGQYEVKDDTVVHHIEVSLFPNWRGMDQVRFFALDDDRLTLSTPPMQVAGVERTAHLVWERV